MQSRFGSVDILPAKCYHKQRRLGVAQFGSVLDWGSRGRRFKSFHPDQKSPVTHVLRGFCYSSAFRTVHLTHIYMKQKFLLMQESADWKALL